MSLPSTPTQPESEHIDARAVQDNINGGVDSSSICVSL
jgi:hypothetical protein